MNRALKYYKLQANTNNLDHQIQCGYARGGTTISRRRTIFENLYSPCKHGRTINSTNQDTNTNQIKTKKKQNIWTCMDVTGGAAKRASPVLLTTTPTHHVTSKVVSGAQSTALRQHQQLRRRSLTHVMATLTSRRRRRPQRPLSGPSLLNVRRRRTSISHSETPTKLATTAVQITASGTTADQVRRRNTALAGRPE